MRYFSGVINKTPRECVHPLPGVEAEDGFVFASTEFSLAVYNGDDFESLFGSIGQAPGEQIAWIDLECVARDLNSATITLHICQDYESLWFSALPFHLTANEINDVMVDDGLLSKPSRVMIADSHRMVFPALQDGECVLIHYNGMRASVASMW